MKHILTFAVAAVLFAACSSPETGTDAAVKDTVKTSSESRPAAKTQDVQGERPQRGEAGERPARGEGGKRRIPQAAIDACAGKSDGATCFFSSPRGDEDVSGTCETAQREDAIIACRPDRPAR